MERRLSAILAADMVGYSRLMEADEIGTLERQKTFRRELIDPAFEKFRGRVVKEMGDGVLVEFASIVDAVECAVQIQRSLREHQKDVAEDRRIAYRIGINLGDIVADGDDIYGDGVNVTARLEQLAEPGGICISGTAYDHLHAKVEVGYESLGEVQVKNIERMIRAYKVLIEPGDESDVGERAPIATPGHRTSLAGDKPSIAVLPFTTMSADPDQEYFADGITEDIITDLSKVSGLVVIARNSTFAYKGQSPDIREVCRDLRVRHVLEGSVRRAGGRVRINAQLIEGSSGGHVWAERYDRDLEDIFAVQDEVTGEIVAALSVALTPGEQKRRGRRDKVDPEAYDCLVLGRTYLYRFTPEANRDGQALLHRAVELDAGLSGVALAWLSISYVSEYVNRWNGAGSDRLEDARKMAQRALSADADEPQAHRAMALVHMWSRNHEEAERAAEKALRLDPNFAGGFTTLGQVRDLAGEHERALEPLGQAIRLDPRHDDIALQFLGRAQFALGHYAEAEGYFKKRLEKVPQSDMTRAFLASLYGETGRLDEAREMRRQLLEVNPDFSIEQFRRIIPYRDTATIERFVEGLKSAGLSR